jgi:glycosyltransferase involved in cell wall biosynthesis
MPKNKVAIVHDVFIEQGGAERVLIAMLGLFPGADVYVPLATPAARTLLLRHGAGKVISSFLNDIPFIHSASLFLKPFLFWYWESLDLGGYDLVISSSHSFSSKAVITGAHTLHASYIHTPPRYLYAEYNETRILKHPLMRVLLAPLLSWLRMKDFIAAQRPDVLIANSKEVQRRIAKYYRREAVIIYPPIQIPVLKKLRPLRKKSYYICFSRLAKQKGIDLAIHACNALRRRLVIIGEGSEKEYLQSIAGDTIIFAGRVGDEKLASLFAGAKAMIYPSLEEDFGMAPVEAMAHGVPVIAHRSGGVRESVQEGKTGLFFDEWNAIDIVRAIRAFEKKQFSAAACRRQAARFSDTLFKRKLRQYIAAQSVRKK